MKDLKSISITGKGNIYKDNYNKIKVVGEAVANESFKCKEFKVLGTCSLKSSAVLSSASILGEVLVENDITSDDKINVLGKLTGMKKCNANNINIKGECIFKENLKFNTMDISGSLNVENDCEGTTLESVGNMNIVGLLSADNIKINPRGTSRINEIGGSNIVIKKNHFRIFNKGKVIVKSIEGDSIILENTECDIVRGHDITILSNCRINKIEYTGTLKINNRSKVEEVICLKN